MAVGTSPNPMAGDRGELWIAPTEGAALVKVCGNQDCALDRGQNFADAHGMDSDQGFEVALKGKPSLKLKNFHDWAATTIMKARRETDAGRPTVFAFYPKGGFGAADSYDSGIRGRCWLKVNSAQDMGGPINNDVEVRPAPGGSWVQFGDYAPS